MDILIQATQFILSLSLLIVLHELGHFIPAKIFKTRVEKFYLFFDPWFSLVKKKIGGTEYGIGWLPLGGYVKISGMIDESMDKEQMKQAPQPWEFRSKPAWQRLIIMLGGVTVNIILAVVIYGGMMMYYGEEYLPNENVTYGITADSTAQAIGLRNGDKIIEVDGTQIERFSQIPLEILLGDEGRVLLERDGKQLEVLVSETDKRDLIKSRSRLVGLRVPYVVSSFTDSSAAEEAGMLEGDSLVGVNGDPLYFFDQYLEAIPQLAGDSIAINIVRNGAPKSIAFQVPESGRIGVYSMPPGRYFAFETKKYNAIEAIPAGINKSFTVLGDYIRQFKLILNPDTEAYKEVGGFLMIAQQYGTKWDWQRFWGFTAFLSIMLAFLNILPIPALDGGHVVFVLWEMVSGRKPNEKVLEYAQVFGFVILMGLILLANGNDILRLFQ